MIFFFDIDGTLVDHNRGLDHISANVSYALQELSKEHYIFVATGRPQCLLPQEFKDFGFSGLVMLNGAHVNFKGEDIFSHKVDYKIVKEIIDYCESHRAIVFLEDEKALYVNRKDNLYYDFISAWHLADVCKPIDELVINSTNALMMAFEDDESYKECETHFKDVFVLKRHSGFLSFDVEFKDINKAEGIKQTLKCLNLDVEDAYCFGDGLNDLQMMAAVGHPVAMANGFEETKKAAKEICGDVLEDGIYHYLVDKGLVKKR